MGSNFLNDNLRYKFARYPVMHQIFRLHFDGDAKSDYLGNNYKKISIKIIPMEGLMLERETLDVFSKKV